MSGNKRHVHADLIIQWAEGKEVQYKVANEWIYIKDPQWHEDTEYRIKPEKVDKWLWVVKFKGQHPLISSFYYSSEEDLKSDYIYCAQEDFEWLEKLEKTKVTVEE